MEDILALIGRVHQGDKEARDILAEKNMGLVHSIAKRFQNRGVEMEDLIQIGSIGLLKAIDKFDLSYNVKFSTYAVPMITGEIKRYLRDDGMVKVRPFAEGDSSQSLCGQGSSFSRRRTGSRIWKNWQLRWGISREELVMALESGAQIESLQKTIYESDGSDISLEDKLPQEKSQQEEILNKMFLEEILGDLSAKERELIYLRFFQEKTQAYIGEKMGLSQVQVSRMEKKILGRLREKL